MSHPRAVFPAALLAEYRSGASLKDLAASYRAGKPTLRRWLIEHGATIRPQGVRPI